MKAQPFPPPPPPLPPPPNLSSTSFHISTQNAIIGEEEDAADEEEDAVLLAVLEADDSDVDPNVDGPLDTDDVAMEIDEDDGMNGGDDEEPGAEAAVDNSATLSPNDVVSAAESAFGDDPQPHTGLETAQTLARIDERLQVGLCFLSLSLSMLAAALTHTSHRTSVSLGN